MEKRLFTMETLKETLFYRDTAVMKTKFIFPRFLPLSSDKSEKSFTDKINSFYYGSTRHYISFLKGKYCGKAYKNYLSGQKVKSSFIMNCQVCLCNKSYVSIFADLSRFDTKNTHLSRFSQLWSFEKATLLPVKQIFNISRKTTQYITGLIKEIAYDNMSKKEFSYYDNFEKIIDQKFNFSNFYIVPDGVAFYYDYKVLSSSQKSPCVFVIPFNKLDNVLKLNFS